MLLHCIPHLVKKNICEEMIVSVDLSLSEGLPLFISSMNTIPHSNAKFSRQKHFSNVMELRNIVKTVFLTSEWVSWNAWQLSICVSCCVILGASKWGHRLEKLWRNRGRNIDLMMSGSCVSVAEYLHTKCCTDGSRSTVCSLTAAGWGETEDLTTVCGGRVTEESMPTYGYSGTGPTLRCGLSGLFLQATTTLKYQWIQFCLW